MPSPKLAPAELTEDERRVLGAWARRRTISGERVETVITATLEQPGGDTHWPTRSMARSAGLSQSAVPRIWRAFGLKPHVIQTWKLSTDPRFIKKVRDVVGLSLAPPEDALVLCVDQKSQIQALERTAPCLPLLPTTPARMTHDYVRNGTTSLFAAFELSSGSVIAQSYRRHRHQGFLCFLKLIDQAVPKDLDLYLVLDNCAAYKTPRSTRGCCATPASTSTARSPVPAKPASATASSASSDRQRTTISRGQENTARSTVPELPAYHSHSKSVNRVPLLPKNSRRDESLHPDMPRSRGMSSLLKHLRKRLARPPDRPPLDPALLPLDDLVVNCQRVTFAQPFLGHRDEQARPAPRTALAAAPPAPHGHR